MSVYFGEKIDVGHSSYLKGLSDYRNKSVIIFNENVILYEISLLPYSLFFALSLPFLSTRLWYDFRECGTPKKPRFSALPDQMAANFRKLGIQKSTMIHDIFN